MESESAERKTSGGKRMFGLEVNTVLSIVALLIIVYVLFKDARDDRTAGEAAKAAVLEVRGEVNSRSGELEELQKEVFDFKRVSAGNVVLFSEEDRKLAAEISALKLKVDALEMRPVATLPPLPTKVEPIRVAPVKVEVELRYPQRPARPDLSAAKRQLEKTVRKKK